MSLANHIPRLSTHSQRVERWLGAAQAEVLVAAGKGWHGPPIPIIGVPGCVYLRGSPDGGDFVGPIDGGFFGNLYDFAAQRARGAIRRTARRSLRTAGMGFSSLGDLISEAGSKKRIFLFQKTGTTGVVGATSSLWAVGAQPSAGAIGAAAPGGTAHTDATTGGFPFANPAGGDTQHLTLWNSTASVAANALMMYDRLFSVAVNMNSTGVQAVTGVPTRYQSSTGTDPDYSAGNFLFFETISVLAATAHNWNVCQYTDQDGNAAVNLPSLAGVSGCIANRLDMPVQTFMAPLAAGDTGVKALTQVQLSAAVATGTADAVLGHPLGILAHPIINTPATMDGVTGAFSLNRIFDDACIAFLEITKPATGTTTYSGYFESVAG